MLRMNAKRAGYALALSTTVALMFSGTASAAPAPCDTVGSLAWRMPLKSTDVGQNPGGVFSRSEFRLLGSVKNTDNRMSIANGPDGRPAIKMYVPKGENKTVSMTMAPLGSTGIKHACLSLRVYLSSGFDFGTAGTKLGWGLFGGTGSKDSGGTPPEEQKGWTERNVTSRWGSRIYSYHLNRNEPRRSNGNMFGSKSQYSKPLPTGRWFNIHLEVKVNDLGKSNGHARMWVDNEYSGEIAGMVLRTSSRNWLVRGLQFTDMWGGTTSAPENFSPRYQSIFYSDYRIYDMNGETVASDDTSSGDSSSGGGFTSTNDGSTGSGADCTNPRSTLLETMPLRHGCLAIVASSWSDRSTISV